MRQPDGPGPDLKHVTLVQSYDAAQQYRDANPNIGTEAYFDGWPTFDMKQGPSGRGPYKGGCGSTGEPPNIKYFL